jgi:uncharacterized integral membrane protein (TIGR02327 family)
MQIPDVMDSAARLMGMTSIFNIIVTVGCIWVAWWVLQGFRIDIFMRNPGGTQTKVLLIMLSVIIGHLLASFIIDYLQWSLLIKRLL